MRETDKCSGLYSGLMLLLCASGLALSDTILADPAVPISECREQSVDQSGFDECLLLLLQQSVSALNKMEKNWHDVLTPMAQPINETVNPGKSVDSEKSASNDSGVIAIISDGTSSSEDVSATSRIINLDDKTALSGRADEKSKSVINPRGTEQFGALPALFRRYRDQRCGWEAGMQGVHRERNYEIACAVALNRERVLQLRQLLVEKFASDSGGESYRGYYIRTASGGSFQSCDRRQDWWVTGAEDVLTALERRYSDVAAENLEMVFVELRGHAGNAVEDGPGSDYVGTLEISAVNLMRPILDHDCRAVGKTVSSAISEFDEALDLVDEELTEQVDDIDPPAAVAPAVTVDDLGSAGFLYGYFSNWMSACAVEKLSVCQAQTQAEYSTDGSWLITVDRSSKSDWRIRIIPTTDNHQPQGPLRLSLDGVEITAVNTSDGNIEIGRGIVVAQGQSARDLLVQMRAGQSVNVDWERSDQISARISFSLTGITRALQYFNQAEK